MGVLRGQNQIPSCCLSVMLSPPKPLDEIQPKFGVNYKVNFKDFFSNFVCVLTNDIYKTYQTGFSLCSLGHAPGVGLWGAGGAQVVKIIKHGHVKQNRMQVQFSSKGQTGDLGVRSKVRYH